MQNRSGLPDRRKGTYSWYIVWVLLAVSILSYVDRLVFSFLVGPIKAELHLLNWYSAILMQTFRITTRVVAWTYGPAFLLGGTLGALSFAPVVKSLDRRGHPNAAFTVAGWTLAVITVAMIAAPLMPNLAGAIFFSFITLFCSAMTVTAAYSITTSVVPAELRGMYTAAYMAVMNITGGAFGAAIVGLLTDYVVSASRLNLALVIMALVFGPISLLLIALAGRHFRKHGAFGSGLEMWGDLDVGAPDQPIQFP